MRKIKAQKYYKMSNIVAIDRIKTVLITGGTGLIGKKLSQLLTDKGYDVWHYSRKQRPNSPYRTFLWNVEEGTIDTTPLSKVDAIIHLAGENVAESRWTAQRKREIINSRTNSLRLLHDSLRDMQHQVQCFVSASAVGYYGNHYGEVLTEESSSTNDFLSRTTQWWEDAAQQIASMNIRTAILRIGIVLSGEGGALPLTALPLKFRVGTYFGNGDQYYSWIHLDDVANMFIYVMENNLAGIYNAVAPEPVTNKEFVRNIAVAQNRPSIFVPIPAFALRAAMGEMAAVVLDSAFVSSEKIQDMGFRFKYPKLELALKVIYKRS